MHVCYVCTNVQRIETQTTIRTFIRALVSVMRGVLHGFGVIRQYRTLVLGTERTAPNLLEPDSAVVQRRIGAYEWFTRFGAVEPPGTSRTINNIFAQMRKRR